MAPVCQGKCGFSIARLVSRTLHAFVIFHKFDIVLPSKAAAKMGSVAKVNVRQGTVVGGESTLPNGSPYYYFKGIPYAVPPLGELRFRVSITKRTNAIS